MGSKISDVELRDRQFVISDPQKQPDLIDSIPDGIDLGDILNLYEYEYYPEQKIRCAICKSKKHKRGVTVQLSSGCRALIGSSCGEKKFGQS